MKRTQALPGIINSGRVCIAHHFLLTMYISRKAAKLAKIRDYQENSLASLRLDVKNKKNSVWWLADSG